MQRFAWSLFFVTLVAAAAIILGTESQLPPVVATHFGGSGRASGFMPREGYLALMLGLAIALPLVVVASTAWLPRLSPRLLSSPLRRHWDQTAQRPAILKATAALGAISAALTAAFIAGMHLVILAAHRVNPPQLDNALFVPLLVGFLALLFASIFVYQRQLRRV